MINKTINFLRTLIVCTVASTSAFWKQYSCFIVLVAFDILVTIASSFFSVTSSIVICSLSLAFYSTACLVTLILIALLYRTFIKQSNTEDIFSNYDDGTLNVITGLIYGCCMISFFAVVAFIVILLLLII